MKANGERISKTALELRLADTQLSAFLESVFGMLGSVVGATAARTVAMCFGLGMCLEFEETNCSLLYYQLTESRTPITGTKRFILRSLQ